MKHDPKHPFAKEASDLMSELKVLVASFTDKERERFGVNGILTAILYMELGQETTDPNECIRKIASMQHALLIAVRKLLHRWKPGTEANRMLKRDYLAHVKEYLQGYAMKRLGLDKMLAQESRKLSEMN